MARRQVVKEVKNVGRPTKFTPERCASIVKMVYNYVPHKLAAEANGICEETLCFWLSEGACDLKKNIYSDKAKFTEAIKNAHVTRIEQLTNNINDGMERWQANAWLLERVHRQHFGADAGVIQELQAMFNELKAKFDAKESK
jgi:hypothetical protein